jgi:hypothetical protein
VNLWSLKSEASTLPYNHYHNRKKLDMPQTEKVVNMHSPEGAVQHMMWGTLSHQGVGLVE